MFVTLHTMYVMKDDNKIQHNKTKPCLRFLILWKKQNIESKTQILTLCLMTYILVYINGIPGLPNVNFAQVFAMIWLYG